MRLGHNLRGVNDHGPQPPIPQLTDWAKSNRPAPAMSPSSWYRNEAISGGNWNQLFPYQLMVLDQTDKGTYIVRSNALTGPFVFTLPIPPESFAISMPFAITSSVTLGGYMEEHNGAPTRVITMSGSTGVNVGRGQAPKPNFTFRDSILAGTLQSANTLRQSAQRANSVQPTFPDNTHAQTEFDDVSDTGQGALTGWYQFRLLQLFFESYAELKKTREGRRSRLALATWKDEAVYLCTPIAFDVRKDASSPLEYKYNINLKAFKRVKLEKGKADEVKKYIPIQNDPGKLAQMLNKLGQAREVVQGAKRTISAVGGDIDRTLFEPMRQVMLLVKDILGVPITAADLSDSVIQDAKRFIIQATATGNAVDNFGSNVSRRFKFVSANARAILDNIDALASEQGDALSVLDDPTLSGGVTGNNTAALTAGSRSGQVVGDVGIKDVWATHPAYSSFQNPADNYDFFSQIQVGSLNLPPVLHSKIAKERDKVRSLSRTDFQRMRNDVQATADALAAALGAGNSTYDSIYGLEAPTTTIIDSPTDEDFNTLFHLNQIVIEMNRLAVTTNESPKLNAIAVVAGLAQKAGIAFRVPRSKFAVPFPYGATLEQLAFRYLGTPDRWQEIAQLNGLQAPYVDEVGFDLPLLVNGANNTVFISNADNVFVGQPVWIGSDTVVRTPRLVTKVDALSTTQFMVTVDGEADLDQYITLANAKLEAFLPNTVNSQMLIYIPSDITPKDEDFTSRTIPGVDEHDSLIAVGGIDLLLTPKNDLIITPDGDSRWAVGLTNIIQKVRLALSVVQGTLNRHPQYGLPIEPGMSLADLSAAEVVRAAQGMFADDPTFTGVHAAQITINGPLANLNIAVQIAGTSQVVPISAEVTRP